jgi:murein L,D-transpeptidase YafK
VKILLIAFSMFLAATSFADVVADKIVIDKSDRSMSVYSGEDVITQYKVAIGRGDSDAKRCEGDKRTPEGSYVISAHKADSGYHYALRLSYPSVADTENARALGCNPGGDIMIHGMRNGFGWIGRLHRLFDWTLGCIAITDREIDELAKLAPVGTRVEIHK